MYAFKHQKPLRGMVACCARMWITLHSSPMLQVNYPFFKPVAPTAPLTSIDPLPWSQNAPPKCGLIYKQKTTDTSHGVRWTQYYFHACTSTIPKLLGSRLCYKILEDPSKKVKILLYSTLSKVKVQYCSRHGFLHQRMNTNGTGTK